MAKAATVHVCSECGASSGQWRGQCPGCGAWNTLVEERVAPAPRARGRGGPATVGAERSQVRLLAEVGATPLERMSTAPASSTGCSAGDSSPGRWCSSGRPRDRQVDAHEHGARPPRGGRARNAVCDWRGVRRAGQAAGRAPRRARRAALAVPVLAETELERGARRARSERRPDACVIDSVQTLAAAELGGAPGHRRPGPRGRRAPDAGWPRSRAPR